MSSITGYALTHKIRETPLVALFRGTCNADGAAVVLKVLRNEYPTPAELARLRGEYAILRSLDAPDVVKALALEKSGNGLALVLEDVGERSLDTLIGGPRLPWKTFVQIARSLAAVVERIHRQDILHMDVKPQHFFLVSDDYDVKLIDFGIATRLSCEAQYATPPSMLEGTIAYMSPEQTGRMNRAIDRRSDLYSLGVSLYELLAGVRPFAETDPLELVHCHIAKTPPSPREIAPDVPPILSDIVMRLLSKAAEQRYQGAAGLIADLDACLATLDATGKPTSFPLGRLDMSDRLVVPQKLYGRQTEAQTLVAMFERARLGSAELLLISGHSGIGKSALVHEIHPQIVGRGKFIAGKFDQFGRSIPYAPIVQAYRELVRIVLTEPPAALDAWRTAIVAALGPNGKLMTELIPELELVIGPQPDVQPLGPSESQHRFELVLQNFLRVFTSKDHTLALFLDDLQWADAASLRLLGLMLSAHSGHLLVVGTYRDNEVGAVHPLLLALAELREAGANISEIELKPLGRPDVCELLSDTLHGEADRIEPLAELVISKTHGNPFFLRQFLTTLAKDRLFVFDREARRWAWDLGRIESAIVTDNVVDFMIGKLQRLPAATQHLLRLAACVGHQFDKKTLMVLAEDSAASVSTKLGDALHEGLVVQVDFGREQIADGGDELNSSYRFLHDRVQHAAYSLIDDTDKQAVHLRIGRLMMAHCKNAPKDDELFDVVGHLNAGSALITDEAERVMLSRFNMRAGQKARDAAAHAAAVKLLETSIALLGEAPWSTAYDIAYQAFLAKAECEFVLTHFDEAFALLDALDREAKTTLERVAGGELRVTILTTMNRIHDAAAHGAVLARMLGVEIPEDPAAIGPAIGAAFGAVMGAIGDRPFASLIDLPKMTDPEKLASLRVIAATIPSAYQSNQELMALMILKATGLTLENGNSPLSSYFYIMFGLVYVNAVGDLDAAHRLGQLGIALNEKVHNQAVEGANRFVFGAFISHWCRHISESIEHLRHSLKASLDVGDYIHVGYASTLSVVHRFCRGDDLEELAVDVGGFLDLLGRTGDVINRGQVMVVKQLVAGLRGQTPDRRSLSGEGFDEGEYKRSVAENRLSVFTLLVAQTVARYFAGDLAGAEEAASEAAPHIPFSRGFIYVAEHCFYQALVRAGRIRALGSEQSAERDGLLEGLRGDEDQLRKWMGSVPANFAPCHALVAAELAAVTGASSEAIDLYDRAIELATEHGFLHLQALANELSAKFHLAEGRNKIASVYLTEAHYAYRRWGATAKAQEIAARYPALLRHTVAASPAAPASDAHSLTVISTQGTRGLDLETAIRASQAIASELVVSSLLERLMRILVEHAGAQKGCLVVRRDTRLQIAATVRGDAVRVDLADELSEDADLATTVVQYVARTQEAVVLGDASHEGRFRSDPYIVRTGPKSILCVAMLHQGRLTGVLYLENNAATDVFSPARLELLQLLAAQAAIAFENAKLYGDLTKATAELREANETLEQRVRERTRELAKRNSDMRVVLDNVVQGLLTIDLEGRLLEERSAIVEQWLGPNPQDHTLFSYVRPFNDLFADSLECGLDQVRSDVLPIELALDQLPRRLKANGRELECKYLPIVGAANELRYLLVVIDDVTERLLLAQKDTEQRGMVATVTALLQDRQGFLSFFEEGSRMLDALVRERASETEQKRLLHTIKGNASMFGLELVTGVCHLAEDEIAETGRLSDATLAALEARWARVSETVTTVVGAGMCGIDASTVDVKALVRDVRLGLAPGDIISRLEAWGHEPAERPLGRLALYASAQAQRLGKGRVEVELAAGDVRLDPERFAPLWSTLVHLVRNAVDHGLEHGDERMARGKAEAGRIRLAAQQRGDELVIEVEDDGRGIDWDGVRRIAGQRGAPNATRDHLVRALLQPDFSTRAEVTITSGRGAGMAEVAERVRACGGTLSVESEPHEGTRWQIVVPVHARAAARESAARMSSSIPPS